MLRRRQNLVFAAVLVLGGCAGQRTYAPPEQQSAASEVKHAMMAADPDVGPMLVADIGPLEGGRFRWTGQHPVVNLELAKTEGLRLKVRFWVAEEALRTTGPIEIAFSINSNVLDRVRYGVPGEQLFDQPVPAALLKPGSNAVRMDIDKTYERNGARLGVALVELGFVD